MLEHAVLVDARFVREGVLADDGLVARDRHADDVRQHARGGIEPRGVDARVEIEEGIARLQRHDDFFERAVAGALADAVDGALDLARAGDHGREAVGHRHAEIVVAMHRQADLVDAAHVLAQVAEQLREFVRHRVADGVRNVDRGGAGFDDGFDHLREEIELGARGVFGRELDVIAELARDLHALDRRADDLLLRHVELELAMDGAGGEEHVDALLRRRLRPPSPRARCRRGCSARGRR